MLKKVIVKQYDLKDCGACCLLSIIKYYGGYIPLETIKMDTHVNKNGTTAFHIINAAKKYGFDATGVKTDNLKDLIFPVIAHVEVNNQFNHFVVIYSINIEKEKIQIMDPATGLQIMKLDEFLAIWSNVIIKIYPNTEILSLKKPMNLIKYIINIISKEKNIISSLFCSSFILALLSIITSFYLKFALAAISIKNRKNLKYIIVLFLILTFFKIVTNFIRDYYENYLNKNIDIRTMMPFITHLMSLPLKNVSNRTSGEIITRINEMNNIKDLFSKIFITFSLDLLLALCSLIILYFISKKLFFLLLLMICLFIIVGVLFNFPIYQKINENIELNAKFNNEIIEKVDSFLTIKNINKLELFLKQIEYSYCKYLKHTFNFNNFLLNGEFLKKLVNELGMTIITSVGLLLIMKGEISLVTLITFNSILVFLMTPLKNLIDILPKINMVKASFNKINEFLSLQEEQFFTPKQKFINGDISISNLTFSYNEYDLVCNNLDIFIKKGTKVMFKGSSGCGKSTVCKLLYRLYDYDQGKIKINNINILDYNLNTIRNNITYLAQKENLFTDTIYNNIVLDNKVSTKKFYEIAKICRLEEIVSKKPLRFETLINNQSYNISGGERQRILLARALIKNSTIIILDEALNEVDEILESNIIKDLCIYLKDKTLIYVSHRNNQALFDEVINFKKANAHV